MDNHLQSKNFFFSTDESLSDLFALYPVLSELIQPPGQVQLFVAYRSDHVPVLHIREARSVDCLRCAISLHK